MSSNVVFLLYCFTSGVAYAGWFHDSPRGATYWWGLAGLCLFNALLGILVRTK